MRKMLYAVVAITNLCFMIAQFALNGIATSGNDGVVLKNDTRIVSQDYPIPISPASWTFGIWGFIYAWQALLVIYSVVNIFRKNEKGAVCDNPRFLPVKLWVLCILISSLNITWLITFDRGLFNVSCAVLIAYTLVISIARVVSYRALDKASPQLVKQNQVKDIWLTRALVHNGLAIHATWITIATLINLALVLAYSGDRVVDADTAGTILLAILSFLYLSYVFADFFLLDRFTRYTITPYMVLIVALIGSLDNDYHEGERNSVFRVVLLALGSAFLLVKIVVTIYKHFRRERYVSYYTPTIGEKQPDGILA
ncbi:uncharacterized protein LOC129921820 [Biomphalaria glabrata]|uniref:Uncharacterized protein LOC129921820 n=1 Tax=Biomphalaria glabrata TaxID=6526 RepID=A0A9W2YDN9_BIOGL|nr:uncharacterized protein LOC129921820 [Biomphalaria glabrata]